MNQCLSKLLWDHHTEPTSEIFEDKGSFVAGSTEMYRALYTGDLLQSIEEAKKVGAWSHALILSTLMERSVFQDTLYAFASALPNGSAAKTLYFLFSGKQDDAMKNILSDVSGEALGARWHQQLAIFIANRSRIKDSFLVHFGDQLWQENLIVAAHLTYLLANIEMDPADAQNRVILLTADTFRNPLHYWKDVNAFQLTEIYEGIRRKSNSQFSMPYLVMYKMIYAGLACEYGFTERSKR
jgi:hypothetical protein